MRDLTGNLNDAGQIDHRPWRTAQRFLDHSIEIAEAELKPRGRCRNRVRPTRLCPSESNELLDLLGLPCKGQETGAVLPGDSGMGSLASCSMHGIVVLPTG